MLDLRRLALSASAGAFVLGGAIWAATAAGTTPGTNGQIAFSHPTGGGTFALSVVGPDGSGQRDLTRPPHAVQDGQPDWSPDGSTLAFQRCGLRCEIWTVRTNGSGLRRLGPDCHRRKPPACEDRVAPVWSPDGRSIAFARDWGPVKKGRPFGKDGQIEFSELAVSSASGGKVRRVTHLTRSRPYSIDVGRATWSPDGKTLAFGVTESPRGKPRRGKALFVVNVDGTGLRRLTPWKLRAGDHPDWSPDGQRILFGAGATGKEDRGGNLYTIRPDGAGLTKLTNSTRANRLVFNGSFSPDGAWVTFVQLLGSDPFVTNVFVMRPDGTGIQPVTGTNFAFAPDWGPSPSG